MIMTEPAARTWITSLVRLLFVLVTALCGGFILTLLVSANPLKAYGALLTGAWPDISLSPDGAISIKRMTRLGSLIEDATTLTLVGLAVAIPFRARQFSMGADGQLFLGALAAGAVSLSLAGPSILVLPCAFAAAMAAGFLLGLLPGFLKARFGTNEIVTTLMLNIIAVQFYRLMISTVMRDPHAGFITTPAFPAASVLAPLMTRTHVTYMALVAVLASLAAWLLIRRTTTGLEITLVGENPRFSAHAGVPVAKATALSMAIGGAFAGIAGFGVSNGLFGVLTIDLQPGIGFEGIVVALLARGNPLAIPIVAVLYAYLRVGAQVMERTSDVTREMVLIIQAFIILLVIAERFGPSLFSHWFKRITRAEQAA